jgi:2-C-methyl-D-erythritol 2,4-cyclodiphosphate synthase
MNSGNIGEYFPSNDPKFKNADSISFLNTIFGLLSKNKCRLINVDATIIAERPPLASFVRSMSQNIASKLEIESDRVSIKVKSNNGLGPLGEGKGIAAMAVVLIEGLEK